MIRRSIGMAAVLLILFLNDPAHGADEVSEGQWFHKFLKTAEAHKISRGEGVKVALIDSGVDANHPDLAGAILDGIDLVAKSGDGQTDTDGHGTAMAGLIAGHGRIEGIAPLSKVLPIRASESALQSSGKVAEGIRWARENGAQVISISWSTGSDDLLLRQQVDAALQADIVIVASVGNRPNDTAVGYPAKIPGVLAVAGVDSHGSLSDVSVTGSGIVIAAPSDNISSANPGSGYRKGTGTSDATAIVAGAVALVRSTFPELSAKEVVRRLTATATDKGAPGRDNQYGYGVLNLVAALTADLPTATTAPTTTAPAISSGPGAPSDPDGFPWWLLAVLPIVAVAIAIVIWRRQRGT